MMKKSLGLLILVSLLFSSASAQRQKKVRQERSPIQETSYTNKNYLSSIQSVQFYNEQVEQSLPLMNVNSNEQLFLAFDDLRGDHRALYFSFEHCDVNWKKSSLSSLEYSSGYGEDRIQNFSLSRNTLQPFTHYEVRFPTENTKPILAGNYLLKVYEDGDKERLLLTRRFYVMDNITSIDAKIGPALDVKTRKSNQRIEAVVHLNNLIINNPNQDIRVLVMQNNRPDIQLWANKPSSIRDNILSYSHPTLFNFEGGQEFLIADLRSFRLESSMVKDIFIDSINHITLWDDFYFDNIIYGEEIDQNGRFYIRNMDQQDQSPTLADYAKVTFTLKTKPELKEVYLLGLFNDFNRTDANKLQFDEVSQTWKIEKFLKQGVYDYLYVSDASSSSFFETKNTYQVFVYYRNPRFNRDEIIGFYELNTTL